MDWVKVIIVVLMVILIGLLFYIGLSGIYYEVGNTYNQM